MNKNFHALNTISLSIFQKKKKKKKKKKKCIRMKESYNNNIVSNSIVYFEVLYPIYI
jgi:hypothetical protein